MLNCYKRTLPTSNSTTVTQREWMIAIFLVIIQQGAFVDTASFLYSGEGIIVTENVFNTATIAISILLLCVASYRVLPRMQSLALRNPYSIIFILMVLSSVIWSVHPDLSLKRGCAYVLTIGIASYIAVRFTPEQTLLVLARSFAICGICSVLFVLLFPGIGIMSGGDLEGNWRGIYSQKNVFGFAMAIAVFVQLQIIATGTQRKVSSYFWVCFYLTLVVLSRSTTAFIISVLYIFVTINYILWRKNKLYSYNMSMISTLGLVSLFSAFYLDPDFFLSIFGKDFNFDWPHGHLGCSDRIDRPEANSGLGVPGNVGPDRHRNHLGG